MHADWHAPHLCGAGTSIRKVAPKGVRRITAAAACPFGRWHRVACHICYISCTLDAKTATRNARRACPSVRHLLRLPPHLLVPLSPHLLARFPRRKASPNLASKCLESDAGTARHSGTQQARTSAVDSPPWE